VGLFFWRREGPTALKAVMGLGNPGAPYAETRHNVAWWLLDHLVLGWRLGGFRRGADAATAEGKVQGHSVRLVKPLRYMNRSSVALAPLLRMKSFDPGRDLLVVVDDVALEPGRVRFRPSGGAGGHNGLRSIERALGTQDYPRLRLGVGSAPPEIELSDWVLSPPSPDDRARMESRFPELAEGVIVWMSEGIEAAMNRCNN
jgi:peptidyl-tRNA hydrolase, PTH1 family